MSNTSSTETHADDGPTPSLRNAEGSQVYIWGGYPFVDGKDVPNDGVPVLAKELDGVQVKQIACADGFQSDSWCESLAYILTEDGKLKQWGRSRWFADTHESREITSGSLLDKRIVHIAAGFNHYVAIDEDGALYSWGLGKHGVLGHGNEQDVKSPKRIEALGNTPIKHALCGEKITVAVTMDGKCYSWGSDSFHERGYTGHGNELGLINIPRVLQALEGKTVVQVSVGKQHTAVVTDEGELFTWGKGREGQLGNQAQQSSLIPRQVEFFRGKKVKQVSCGWCHTFVLTEEGQIFAFGDNSYFQLGYEVGDDEATCVDPTDVRSQFADQKAKFVACGKHHTAIVTNANEIYTCGSNDCGELGHGIYVFGKSEFPEFKLVEKLKGFEIKQVLCLEYHTVVLLKPNFSGPDSVPISSSLRSMVNNKECADVIFTIEGQKVYGHKVFLIQRSEYFRSMFKSGMRESNDLEIPLSGITKPVLLLVLEYLYTGEVSVPIEMILDLYIAAGLYTLDRLLQICCDSLTKHLTVDNSASMLLETHDDAKVNALHEICFNYVIKNFKEVSKTDGMAKVSKNDALALRLFKETAEYYC